MLGLICGADGVATFSYDGYLSIAAVRRPSLRISCHRQHRKYYEIKGPDGRLDQKVAPSDWHRILDD
jgi:hypothetical protein